QQRTPILAVVEHAKLPPDQHPDEHGGPTGRLTAHDKWTCVDQLHEAWLLLGGQLRVATATMAVDQLIIPNWQISSKILKLLKMRHENASSSSRSNRIPDSGGA